MSVAAFERQFVVHLQEVGNSVTLPKGYDTFGYVSPTFAQDRIDTGMARIIADDCQQEIPLAATDISWPDQVHDLHVQRRLGVVDAALLIWDFLLGQPSSLENPIDGRHRWRFYAPRAKVVPNRECARLHMR